MRKANSRLAKEMDLQKFLHRQRIFITSLLGLLKSRQSSFVDKFSQLVIRESTDMEATSQDADLSDLGHGDMHFVGSMVQSSNCVDKRLINIYKLRQEEQQENAAIEEKKALEPSELSNKIIPVAETAITEDF